MPGPALRIQDDDDGLLIEAQPEVFQAQGLAQQQEPDADLSALLDVAQLFGVEETDQLGGMGASEPIAQEGGIPRAQRELRQSLAPINQTLFGQGLTEGRTQQVVEELLSTGEIPGGTFGLDPEGLVELHQQMSGALARNDDVRRAEEARRVREDRRASGEVEEIPGIEGPTARVRRNITGDPDPLETGAAGTQTNISSLSGNRAEFGTGAVGTVAAPVRRRGAEPSNFLEQELRVRPPLPPEMQQNLATLDAEFRRAREMAAAAQVQGLEDQAAKFEEEAQRRAAEALAFHDVVDEARQETDREIGKLRDLVDIMSQSRVNPDAFWENRGEASRFASAISFAVQTAVSTVLGTPNNAGKIIERAIDRDIAAQARNIDQLGQTAQIKMNLLGAMNRVFNDRMSAFNAYRALRLSHAAAEFQSQAAKSGAIQAATNFIAVEAALRQQAAQAAAEAWQNQFAFRVRVKSALAHARAQAYVDRALGLSSAVERETNRAGRARQQASGLPAEGSVIPEHEVAAVIDQLRANGMTALSVPNREGMFEIVRQERFSPVSIEQAERLGQRGGFPLGGFIITEDAQAVLQSTSAEDRAKLMQSIRINAALQRVGRELVEMARGTGFKPASEWTSEARRQADGKVALMRTLTARALGLGALTGPDLGLVSDIVSNPLDAWEPGNWRTLAGRLQSMDSAVEAEVVAIGGRRADVASGLSRIDALVGDAPPEPEPSFVESVMETVSPLFNIGRASGNQ